MRKNIKAKNMLNIIKKDTRGISKQSYFHYKAFLSIINVYREIVLKI